MTFINQNQIRNFIICAHIDHGKSTLADRFLELTNTIPKDKMRPQYLDMMDLEREKGITIKMQPVRMNYTLNAKPYTLNLIDTPGHVDFSYEVSRSLAAVEGTILLVDATKGIQAQTLANLELATKQGLIIIPVINKIDSPQAKIKETKEEIAKLFKKPEDEIFEISAKLGTNVVRLLDAVIEKVPPPIGYIEKPFKALIFDSKYDIHKGIIAYVRVFDGTIKRDEKIYLMRQKTEGSVKEIGYFKPELKSIEELKAGEIGYIATGIKEPGKVRVGDTITKISNFKFQISNLNIEPLPGYQEPEPMVFASISPENPDDFGLLKEAVERLKLNDASFIFEAEMREYLGRGFRCGFLGLLHAEIITERLKREFGLNLVLSTPSVIYKSITKEKKERLIYTSADWLDPSRIEEVQELWVKIQILTPLRYFGPISELLTDIEANHINTDYLVTEKAELIYESPLREIITKNFYDKLKSVSQGFASMSYEILDWRKANLVKLDILILGKKEESFSRIVSEKDAHKEGKKLVEKLKETLPSQLFAVPIQAAVGGKIIARENIKAKRRDVIAPLYGGDYTRKRKLLEKQKKGKKELKEKGEIHIPASVFLEIFRG